MTKLRVGQGWDVHRLIAGDHLRLGGVEIPFHQGLLAHSDGDLLCHAVTDALLGGAKLGDIGRLFPDTDPQYQNADSLILLEQAVQQVRERGWQAVNLDATIMTDQPKLGPYIPRMEANLARVLGLEPDQVSVKAKTMEGLPCLGAGQCIQAMAVILLEQTGTTAPAQP